VEAVWSSWFCNSCFWTSFVVEAESSARLLVKLFVRMVAPLEQAVVREMRSKG
jgi:hypothetical protein